MDQDYQHSITMEQLHQAMQNASSLVHNFQLPISPRQMSNLMLKTNNFGRNINNFARTYDPDVEMNSNIVNDVELPHNLIRFHEEISMTQNFSRNLNNELNKDANFPHNSGLFPQNLLQNDDLRNSLQLIQNIGRNISENLPLHLDRNDSQLAQEIGLHHLNRSQNLDMNNINLLNDRRAALSLSQNGGGIESRLNQMVNNNRQDNLENMMFPMPFQIKSEQEDNQDFYDVNQDFVNGLPGQLSIDNQSNSQNLQADQMYSYYNNQISNMSPQTLSSIDMYARQQNFIQNYSINNANKQNNPQNLVVNKQFDLDVEIIANEAKKSKSMSKAEPIKYSEPKENLKPNEDEEFDDNVEQGFSEKNENDASLQNKIQDTSADDVAYKNLIVAEYANIKGEYSCYKCNEVFSTKRNLKQHTKTCTEQGEVTETVEKGGKISCPQCAYKCQSPAILKIHERTHTGEKPFSCKFCDYKSGQKNNVAKHILVHMKEKPFRCQYCDYRCAQKNNLVVHERTHTGYKPFACTFCDYRTVQKPNLVKHMYLHTDQKPFSCDLCNYRCVQKTNLTKHKQRHLNEKSDGKIDDLCKPYKPRKKTVRCEICSYKCVQKSSLDKHMQFKHADLIPNVEQQSDFFDEKLYVMQGLNLMKNSESQIQNLSVRRNEIDEVEECQKMDSMQMQS